jgi:hypothetical protein
VLPRLARIRRDGVRHRRILALRCMVTAPDQVTPLPSQTPLGPLQRALFAVVALTPDAAESAANSLASTSGVVSEIWLSLSMASTTLRFSTVLDPPDSAPGSSMQMVSPTLSSEVLAPTSLSRRFHPQYFVTITGVT